jgi:hypothetical protein
MLNPPTDLLTAAEAEIVVESLRATDLGAANRELRQKFPQWDLARRLAALRQAQGVILDSWAKSPARKRREALLRSHAGESHKEGRPEIGR